MQLKNLNPKASRHSSRRALLIKAALIGLLALALLGPLMEAEAKKKGKKVLKELAKGLILKNLSTRKNFLPLPVPIPVPIELSEPPVYLKGKPKYVTIYKPAPVIKPTTVYHMPVYSPTYEYMSMDPMNLYGSMMMAGGPPAYEPAYAMKAAASAAAAYKSLSSSSSPSSAPVGSHAAMNFNDYDDEFGNYYSLRSKHAAGQSAKLAPHYDLMQRRSSAPAKQPSSSAAAVDAGATGSGSGGGGERADSATAMRPVDEQEQIDDDEERPHAHRRTKRQVYYKSGYDGERNCHGFPLEINVRSRIKMDQIFPIHGNSQFKKCIKVGRPLLPPVEDDDDQYHRPPY